MSNSLYVKQRASLYEARPESVTWGQRTGRRTPNRDGRPTHTRWLPHDGSQLTKKWGGSMTSFASKGTVMREHTHVRCKSEFRWAASGNTGSIRISITAKCSQWEFSSRRSARETCGRRFYRHLSHIMREWRSRVTKPVLFDTNVVTPALPVAAPVRESHEMWVQDKFFNTNWTTADDSPFRLPLF